MGVQEVSLDKDSIEPTSNCTFSSEKEIANHHLGTGFFVLRESDEQ
jgi:hypothetical protein